MPGHYFWQRNDLFSAASRSFEVVFEEVPPRKGLQDVSRYSTLSKMPFVGVCKRPYLAGYKCHASYRVKGHRIGKNGPAYYIPQNKETYDFNFVH